MFVRTLAATALIAHAAVGQTDEIGRESVGARLTQMSAMELTPFDASLWSALSDWHGTALDAENTAGQVVLIATWASWNPTSQRVLPTLQRLYEQHKDDGLIVVGVHHPKGYDNAEAVAKSRGLTFPIALDAEGKVREALNVDQDPDLYFIDRSGQIRFADVRTDSAMKAAQVLLAESRDDAAETQARLDAAAAEREREFRTIRTVESDIALNAMPEVPFAQPSDAAYAAVKWPKVPESANQGSRFGEEVSSVKVSLPEDGWVGGKPEVKGRVIVMYHWHPDLRESHTPFMHEIDELAQQRGRDVAVVGALSIFEQNNVSGRSRQQEEEWKDPERLGKLIREYHDALRLHHSLMPDFNDTAWENSNVQRGSSGDKYVPFAAIYSSDGTLRWWGYVGPMYRHSRELAGHDAFLAALDKMIDVDPGVKARREAEQKYLRSIGR